MLLHAGNFLITDMSTEFLSRDKTALEVRVEERVCSSME